MKLMSLFAIVTFASNMAFARALNSADKALGVRDQIQDAVLQIEGVNGIGVGGCDPSTGLETDFTGDWVHCVVVYAQTAAALTQLRGLYPPRQTKIGGVFVMSLPIGEIVPQPRMSGGN